MNNQKQWIVGLGILGVVALLAALALGWFGEDNYSEDPVVANLEKLRDEAMERPEEQRDAFRGQMRDAMEGLSSEQRQSFFERSMPIFVKLGAMQMEKRYDDFMALSPEERRQELDKQIDEQIARQRAMQAGGGNAGPGGGGPRGGPRGGPPNMTPEKVDEFRKKMQDWTTPDQRAKFETMLGMLNNRRAERGLEPVNFGR